MRQLSIKHDGKDLQDVPYYKALRVLEPQAVSIPQKILRLSEDLPIVIEIVDAAEKIEVFIQELDSMIDEGLVTLENIQVLLYRHDKNVA